MRFHITFHVLSGDLSIENISQMEKKKNEKLFTFASLLLDECNEQSNASIRYTTYAFQNRNEFIDFNWILLWSREYYFEDEHRVWIS